MADTASVKVTNIQKNGHGKLVNSKDINQVNNEMVGKKYEKELTVCVELQGSDKVSTSELMRTVRLLCGGLMACRATGEGKYEMTMNHPEGKKRLLEGLKIGDVNVFAKELSNNELVVSFLNLPAYVTDEDILEKLKGWGVSATSPIKRRMWPGTTIADGTRFMRVKFNKQVQSLPYSAKFETVSGTEFFRVIHDRQVKVCRLCIQPGHVLRECPEFYCHKCGEQGHYARECHGKTAQKCSLCHNLMTECICNQSDEEGGVLSELGHVSLPCTVMGAERGEGEMSASEVEDVAHQNKWADPGAEAESQPAAGEALVGKGKVIPQLESSWEGVTLDKHAVSPERESGQAVFVKESALENNVSPVVIPEDASTPDEAQSSGLPCAQPEPSQLEPSQLEPSQSDSSQLKPSNQQRTVFIFPGIDDDDSGTSSEMEVTQITNVRKRHNERKSRIRNKRNKEKNSKQ